MWNLRVDAYGSRRKVERCATDVHKTVRSVSDISKYHDAFISQEFVALPPGIVVFPEVCDECIID